MSDYRKEIDLLRDEYLAGRLSAYELAARCKEVWAKGNHSEPDDREPIHMPLASGGGVSLRIPTTLTSLEVRRLREVAETTIALVERPEFESLISKIATLLETKLDEPSQ